MNINIRTSTLALAAVCTALLASTAGPAKAEETASLFGTGRVASVTYGPYLRLDVGRAAPSYGGANWRPPGFDPDPEIRFGLSGDDSVTHGSLAVGFDWQNGWRGDVGIVGTGTDRLAGPCIGASDASDCSVHADIESASIKTTGIMGHVFYSPFEAQGSNSPFQPFFVFGAGVARNKVGEWTRVNAGSLRPSRTFEGDSTSSLALSVGVGASYQITKPGEWPIILEGSIRYFDFGEASGGSTPLPGNGSEGPVRPLTFDTSQSVVSFGVRIPLKRY
mgnify:CR=1 FL=1